MRNRVLAVFIVVLLAGCSAESTVPEQGQQAAQLKQVPGCDTLLVQLKQQAIQEMEERIDELMLQVFQWDYCGWSYHDDGGYFASDSDGDRAGGMPAPGGTEQSEANGESAGEYSETNNQVAGVAEADFIKNDGSHIYILADGRLQIVDAWPPEEARVISSVNIEGEPKKLFVTSDRALVYSSLDPITVSSGDYGPWGYYGGYYGSSECTYGYNCDFTGDGRELKITVFDISDRTNPVLRRELRFSGSYLNARRIGDSVHTAIVFPKSQVPELQYWPSLMDQCWSGTRRPTRFEMRMAFSALKSENRRKILESDLRDWLPAIEDNRQVNGQTITSTELLQSCDNFYQSGADDGRNFITLLSLDITQNTPAHATTVVGRPGAVYSSAEALYISSRQENQAGWYYGSDGEQPEEASTVHKFALTMDPPSTVYSGSGAVKGRVLNQFSMDEHEGFLRIATTTGHVPSPDVHSTISVLAEHSGQLVLVGQLDGIAPTEDIRSARFHGKQAFIVTFKKTDPLFAIDLSDPTDPRITGELKIPGYSTYMHLLGDQHLLTIGYDADDQGSFAWFQGIMLQIFDVSDMADPLLIHKEVIGSRGSTSDAATDHLAFNFFSARDLLAIPITVCEGGSGGSYGDTLTFSGLLVYDVTVEDGFYRRGGVAHLNPEDIENQSSFCRNWWTSSNSLVKRSVFMDDYVYSVAPGRILIQHVDDLGTNVADVALFRQRQRQ
ncbi:MAG: beta-propeller domain-containing protein [bacterium]